MHRHVFHAAAVLAIGWLAACTSSSDSPLASSGRGLRPAVTTCVFNVVGTTMTLTGNCTTDATILIPDGFTLDGDGYTITAQDPIGDHFRGAVVKNGGSTAHVVDLGVTTSNLSNVCDGGDDRLRGILFEGASGTILNNTVLELNQGASGCQEGNGIEVRNAPFDGTNPNTQTVTIQGNVVDDYQKNGITANGDVSATISDNEVSGFGQVNFIAQNGIQLGFGAEGSASGNSISDNYYTGCSNRDAATTGCTPFVAAGLLLIEVRSNEVHHSQNQYRNNQFNVLNVNAPSLGNI